MVASVAEARLQRDGFPNGIIGLGFQKTYDLTPEQLRVTVRACGLLHDLGKLQSRWQQWAVAWQSSRNPQYRMTAPLAHTDFNPDNEADRTRQLSLDVRRPSHAAASAYYSCALLDSALMGIPTELLGEVASACVAANHRTPWRVHSKDGEYRFGNPCIVEGLGADCWEVRLYSESGDSRSSHERKGPEGVFGAISRNDHRTRKSGQMVAAGLLLDENAEALGPARNIRMGMQ